jgi:hypothetical protein
MFLFSNTKERTVMEGLQTPVETIAYLADAANGQRVDYFHFGQTLRLVVEIQGVIPDDKVAYPYHCSVEPKEGQGEKYYLLDSNG